MEVKQCHFDFLLGKGGIKVIVHSRRNPSLDDISNPADVISHRALREEELGIESCNSSFQVLLRSGIGIFRPFKSVDEVPSMTSRSRLMEVGRVPIPIAKPIHSQSLFPVDFFLMKKLFELSLHRPQPVELDLVMRHFSLFVNLGSELFNLLGKGVSLFFSPFQDRPQHIGEFGLKMLIRVPRRPDVGDEVLIPIFN